MSQNNYTSSVNDYVALYSNCEGNCAHCTIKHQCELYVPTKPKKKQKRKFKGED